VNVVSIKRQKMVAMDKSKHHEMMQIAMINHTNDTQTRMNYPNPNYSLLWV
jgi:hypothetical protein